MPSTFNLTVGSTIWAGSNVAVGGGFEQSSAAYGGYWTWANAKSGGADYTGVATSYTTGNLDGSVCPTEWRLPMYDEISNLRAQSGSDYGSGWLFDNGLFFPYAGCDGGYSGSTGDYWSSTEDEATRAYSLYFVSRYSSCYLTGSYKTGALSVRCVRPK